MSMCSDTLDNIMYKLFEPAKKILQKHIDTITNENTDKTKTEANKKYRMFPAKKGFTYNGIVYVSTEGHELTFNKNNLQIPYKWNPLDSKLEGRCAEIEDLYKLIEKNEKLLPRLFICLLQGASSFMEIRERLPNEICELLEMTGEKSTEFAVPKNIEPLWMMCKDDIQYLINLRLIT